MNVLTTGSRPEAAVVAALPREIAALDRRLTGRRPLDLEGLWASTGRLAQRQVVLLATGDGARRAEAGLRALLDRVAPRRVIALGVAGGLAPGMVRETVVVGAVVRTATWVAGVPRASAVKRACDAGAVEGVVATSAKILGTAEEKRALWRELGEPEVATVDLESAAWAAVAAAAGVECLVLRAVLDVAQEALPLDFERCRGRDGRVRSSWVVARALAKPAAWPALAGLGRRVGRCGARLADVAREVVAA